MRRWAAAWGWFARLCLPCLLALTLAPGCGGGGSTDDVATPRTTTVLAKADTATFPNGSFPKAMALAGDELWVTNQYAKLIVASVDLGLLPDSDADLHPDLCEVEKATDITGKTMDPDDPAKPLPTGDALSSGQRLENAVKSCGDIAFSRVSVLDPTTLAIKAHVDVPREANYIVAGGDALYVTHVREGWLTKIDRATRKLVTARRVGSAGALNEIAWDATRDRLYILDSTQDTDKPKSLSQLITVNNVSAVGKGGSFTVDKLEIPPTGNLTRRVPALALDEQTGRLYVAAYDQKRIYQVDVSVSPPVLATEVTSIKGSRSDLKDVTGDEAKITLDTDMIPLTAATSLKFEDKTFNFDAPFENTDTNGTSTLQAHVAFTIDTNGDATDDRTYHGLLDLEKGELTFYDFVTTSGAKTTVEDKNKIREPVQYKGERMVAKDYTVEGTVAVSFNKDGASPAGLQLFTHGGDTYLGVLYPDTDQLSLVKLPAAGNINTASRFGVLTATGDFPQDLLVFDAYPGASGARLFVTGRNDNTVTSYDVDFTQAAGSSLAVKEIQRDFFGYRPWELLPAASGTRRFYLTLHGENTVGLLENTR